MKRFALITALLAATATPAFATAQLSAQAGVSADSLPASQLIRLINAQQDGDQITVSLILNGLTDN